MTYRLELDPIFLIMVDPNHRSELHSEMSFLRTILFKILQIFNKTFLQEGRFGVQLCKVTF